MGKRYSPGDSVLFNGVPCVVQKLVGGGDYIVQRADGTRSAVSGKNLTDPTVNEFDARTAPVVTEEVDPDGDPDSDDDDPPVED